MARGKQLHSEALKQLTGGLELPGLQSALAGLADSEHQQTDPEKPNE